MMKTSTLAHMFMLLTAILGVTMWVLEPGNALAWAAAIFFLPIASLVLALVKRIERRKIINVASTKTLHLSMIGAALILSLSLAASIAESVNLFDVAEGEISDRAMGVIFGTIMMVYANFMPKSAKSGKEHSVLRFGGWVLVLAGLGYAIVWLIFPLEHANIYAMAVMGTGVILVFARVAWAYMTKRQASPPA